MTVTVLVLDSVGLGALADANEFVGEHEGQTFDDVGSHTLDHTLNATGVALPHFSAWGLGNIAGVTSVLSTPSPQAAYGRMIEVSKGKDTTTGHWEFMGIVLEQPFQTFTHFPSAVMTPFDETTGGHLGNMPASGTEIIKTLGQQHLQTGLPIVYTSADSVFQIAAHTDVVPLATLYEWCQVARDILTGKHAVARVIARPFTGTPGNFSRISKDRKDFSLTPPAKTVLNALADNGKAVIGVGKIADIYNHSGITQSHHTGSNQEGIDTTLRLMHTHPDGLIFCNLVDFDARYGHRRNPQGYAQALANTDARLPELMDALDEDDVLILISDHGNDPTWPGTDHTREYGLLLVYGPQVVPQDLGTRSSFADVGASVAELLGVPWNGTGESFATMLHDQVT